MPPRVKFTREQIVNTALELVRDEGESALTARALGARLGSSSKPIFGLFKNMDEVRQEVLNATKGVYAEYVERAISSGQYPKYMSYGIGYILFAKEDTNLFKMLYMRKMANKRRDDRVELAPIIDIISKNTGLDRDTAYRLHLEMWLLVHGIATTIATEYVDWDMDLIRSMLTDQYLGIRNKLLGDANDSNKNGKSN